jgi:hypothetical protein
VQRLFSVIVVSAVEATLFCGVATAQSGSSISVKSQGSKQHPVPSGRVALEPELQVIVDATAAVPPEFGADVLIQASTLLQKTDRGNRTSLLTKAFYLAGSAEDRVKRMATYGPIDSRTGSLGRAFDLNLDTLSLQARVVSEELALDPSKARALAKQIQFPSLDTVECTDPLSYDLRFFYETAASVARAGFTPKERARGDINAFLMPYISQLQSHAQVGPAAQLLVAADLPVSELAELLGPFTQSLSQLTGDPRSFEIRTNRGSVEEMARLVKVLDAKGNTTFGLLKAERQYLVSNFDGLHCGEMDQATGSKDPLPQQIKDFNQYFHSALQTYQISPIAKDDLKDARVGVKAQSFTYWETADSHRLLMEVKALRFGNGKLQLTDAAKATPDWSTKLVDYLTDLESWKGDSEATSADYFDEKSILYMALIEIIPKGPSRSKVVDSYVRFLEQTSIQTTSRIEWFRPVADLLSRASPADKGEEVIQALVNSRDPTLSLYGRLARWRVQHSQPGDSFPRAHTNNDRN